MLMNDHSKLNCVNKPHVLFCSDEQDFMQVYLLTKNVLSVLLNKFYYHHHYFAFPNV